MTKRIEYVAEKLSIFFDGFFDNAIGKFLSDLLPQHVSAELKEKRSDGIRRVSDATVGALSPTLPPSSNILLRQLTS